MSYAIMKSMLTLIVLSAALFLSVDCSSWVNNPLLRNTSPEYLKKLRALRQDVVDQGCEINLCFALQGDDFIIDEEFTNQKNFVDLMVAILTTDKAGNFCAVQYGRTTKAISPLTKHKLKFLRDVHGAKRVGGFETNIAAALGYAGFQLRPRVEDANKIIILGDGLSSLGFEPIFVAKKILSEGIDISAIAIGGYSEYALMDIVGGDKNKILQIHEFLQLGEIVFGLVRSVCGLKST